MAGYAVPSLRAYLLGDALRKLREQAGLTQEIAAKELGYTRVWLNRVESGVIQDVKVAIVRSMLSAYGVDPDSEQGQTVINLARAPRRVGWWANHAETMSRPLIRFVAFESEAERELTFDHSLVSGLLQTPEYARAVISVGEVDNDAINKRLTARLTRQELLRSRKPPLILHALMSPTIMIYEVGGPDVLRGQLAHLVEAAEEPNVTVQIVPGTAGARLADRFGFQLLTFGRSGLVLANVETDVGPLLMETGPNTVHLTDVWADLAAHALPPEESIKKIKEKLRELDS